MEILRRQDPHLWEAIEGERRRQRDGLELIASENYTSPGVLAAMGTELTNKYAEGYPGRRYYGGCEFVDQIEQLAIDRAKSASPSSLRTSAKCSSLPTSNPIHTFTSPGAATPSPVA